MWKSDIDRRLGGVLALALAAASAGSMGCSGEDTGGEGDEPEVCPDQPGIACTWAGTGAVGLNGDGKHRLDTMLYWPEDLAFGPDGTPWILDWNNHLIRKVRSDGTVETVVGSFVGDGPPDQSDLTEPGAPGLTVSLNHPTDIVFLPNGQLLFAAWHNHKIRKVDPVSGNVIVLCGRDGGYAGDGGPASEARFNQPKAIALDDSGALYILDQKNFRIRRIDGGSSPNIETVVGTGEKGFSGDGGPPLEAQLEFEAGGNPEPSGALAVGPDGTLYIADALNHRIRKVDAARKTIETIAGTGEPGFSGDGGPATQAKIANVKDLEIGPDGRLYLADTDNHRVRAIDLATGVIQTVAGTGETGPGENGKPPLETPFNRPFGIAFDAAGALYIADTFNSRIVRVPQ